MSAPSDAPAVSLSLPVPSFVQPTPTRAASPSLSRRFVLHSFSRMQRGHLRLHLPGGRSHEFGSATDARSLTLPLGLPASAELRVHREAFFHKCCAAGDVGFAESYIDGDWDTPNLGAIIAWFLLNLEEAPTLSGSQRLGAFTVNLLRGLNQLGHALRPNTRRMARENIHRHYDLSNNFFRLFLDPSMMYSAAVWPPEAPQLSLEAAQREKNDRLCRMLQLRRTDHVLEIGSGWGGWSIHAAQNYGCRIRTVTISRQQYEFARRRIAEAGLQDRIDLQLCDYRDLGGPSDQPMAPGPSKGRFDKIVSIEMMEALGHRYLPEFAAVLDRVLKPNGLVALQFITCPDSRYEQFRRGVDFIQKHIFPGSLLLSLNRVNDLLSSAGGFIVNRVEDFGPDYARTLQLWRDAFLVRLDEVRALGFDEGFIRKWTYYFAYCEAAFTMRNISVVQTLHTRPNNLAL